VQRAREPFAGLEPRQAGRALRQLHSFARDPAEGFALRPVPGEQCPGFAPRPGIRQDIEERVDIRLTLVHTGRRRAHEGVQPKSAPVPARQMLEQEQEKGNVPRGQFPYPLGRNGSSESIPPPGGGQRRGRQGLLLASRSSHGTPSSGGAAGREEIVTPG
jgi:hypothetical protein